MADDEHRPTLVDRAQTKVLEGLVSHRRLVATKEAQVTMEKVLTFALQLTLLVILVAVAVKVVHWAF